MRAGFFLPTSPALGKALESHCNLGSSRAQATRWSSAAACMEVFVRIVLGILILLSFFGVLDDWWRSPVLPVLPVLGVVCFVLSSRIAAQDRKIRELENLLRAKFSEQKASADNTSMAVASHAPATATLAQSASGQQSAPTTAESAPEWNEGDDGDNFAFSVQEEAAPAAPPQAVREMKPESPEWVAAAWSQARAWITGSQ